MTVLALMINFLRVKPAFVVRLSPVRNLKHEYLFECLILLIEMIHNSGGFVSGVLKDDLSINQKAFKSFHEKYTLNLVCLTERTIISLHFL